MDRYAEAALIWCRHQLRRAGLPEPPTLAPWRGCRCPLEQTLLPLHVIVRGTGQAWFYGDAILMATLPADVAEFVRRVDAGFYPELGSIDDAASCERPAHRARCPSSIFAAKRHQPPAR